jgi:hypothetical protein
VLGCCAVLAVGPTWFFSTSFAGIRGSGVGIAVDRSGAKLFFVVLYRRILLFGVWLQGNLPRI